MTDARPVEPETGWFTSSHSGGDGGECVEVATADDVVWVRDTKARSRRWLTFGGEQWSAFLRYALAPPSHRRDGNGAAGSRQPERVAGSRRTPVPGV